MSRDVEQPKLTSFMPDQLYPQLKFYYKHKDDPEYQAKVKANMASWYWRNTERASAYRKEHYKLHREEYKKRSKQRYYEKDRGRYRNLVFTHYGTSCACCGESTNEFLCMDHVEKRAKMNHDKTFTGFKLYRWLVKNNYPPGFQTLCMNCNSAKGFFGACPHEKQKISQ